MAALFKRNKMEQTVIGTVIAILIGVNAFAAPPMQALSDECSKGKGESCNTLGWELFKGKLYNEALNYFDKGCELKVAEACRMKGHVYFVMRDKYVAGHYIVISCQMENTAACEDKENLSALMERYQPDADGFEKSTLVIDTKMKKEIEAVLTKEKAALEKQMSAEEKRQKAEEAREEKKRIAKEKAESKKSASCQEKKNKRACEDLGWAAFSERDYDKALPFLEKACDLKSAKSCHAAGLISLSNHQDLYGKRLLGEACDLKERLACKQLDEIKQAEVDADRSRQAAIEAESRRANQRSEERRQREVEAAEDERRRRAFQEAGLALQQMFAPPQQPKVTTCESVVINGRMQTRCSEH